MADQPCPTPAKTRFATESAALHAAAYYSKILRTYECPCGWYHLTSKPAAARPIDAPLVTEDVVALPDHEFVILAGCEARGQATPEQAAALRNSLNIDRWIEALKHIEVDIQQQLAARKGDYSVLAADWRRRTLAFQRSLHQRRAEAKELHERARIAANAERTRLRSMGTTGPEARAEAGERAIQRLIDAHHAEFGRLLMEEFEVAGLEVPARVARHAARNAAAAR